MSMTAKERAIEYAKNFPVIQSEGLFGPVSISNLSDYNDRVIINLCLKTQRSLPNNASISYPKEWNKSGRYKSGDLVNVHIEGGYVKKMWPAKATSLTSAKTTEVETEVSAQAETAPASEPTKPF